MSIPFVPVEDDKENAALVARMLPDGARFVVDGMTVYIAALSMIDHVYPADTHAADRYWWQDHIVAMAYDLGEAFTQRHIRDTLEKDFVPWTAILASYGFRSVIDVPTVAECKKARRARQHDEYWT